MAAAASAAQARRDHARQIAGELERQHGFELTVEDCNLSAWARRWGRSLAAFSPGTLLFAIEREANAVAHHAGVVGGVTRASTQTTALSQHCLCGHRVKKSLGDRAHVCQACGLRGDRDAISATLGAYVVFTDRTQSRSATVDFEASRASLYDVRTRIILDNTLDLLNGRQDALSESNAHSARDGSSAAEKGRTPDAVVVARRMVGMAPRPNPDETGFPSQTTSERSRTRTNLARKRGEYSPQLRDNS